jgi:hypothetical protein
VVVTWARWREDLGQPVQELESRETQGGATGQVRPREDVEDLVGAAADEVESVEGKRRPGAIADEPLESRAVSGLDTDTRIQTEPAAAIPGEHVLGVVRLQEAVAAKVAQDPLPHGVLEALQELGCEAGGFVEAEAGFRIGWVLIGAIPDPLEEPVHNAEVVVEGKGLGQKNGEGAPEGDPAVHAPERNGMRGTTAALVGWTSGRRSTASWGRTATSSPSSTSAPG